MRRRIKGWAVAVIAVAVTLGVWEVRDASAQTNAICRRKIGQGVRQAAFTILKHKNRCHQFRLRGDLPPAIDCNDPDASGNTWGDNDFDSGIRGIQRAENKLRRKTEFGCDASISTPQQVGYNTCPAPCGSVAITDFDSVATCQLCLLESCTTDIIADTYGTPPVPPPLELVEVCQNETGRAVRTYFNRRLRLQQRCQFKKDRGVGNFFSIECDELDVIGNRFQPRIELFEARLGVTIQEECEFVDFDTEVDMCGTDVPTTISCTRAAVRACGDLLFDSVYPGS